jgi:3-oxoacyl-[acyl-carrier protein] reductase
VDLGLADKVVWITGASGGIGRALAEAFAAEGARVVLSGHARVAELDAWVAGEPWRDAALVLRADVRSADELRRATARAIERWGRIDVCVANAGTWPPEALPLDELPEERLRATLEVNLVGALLTARAFLAALRRTGPRPDGDGAALVFTGSTAGRFGERGHADYAAAKAALVGAVRSLKNEIAELDPRARVNLVEPGWTVTRMARPAIDEPGAVERAVRTMAMRQLGRAADVARAVVWLASPRAARHVSGEALAVSGGMEGRVLWEPEEIDGAAIRARLAHDDEPG